MTNLNLLRTFGENLNSNALRLQPLSDAVQHEFVPKIADPVITKYQCLALRETGRYRRHLEGASLFRRWHIKPWARGKVLYSSIRINFR